MNIADVVAAVRMCIDEEDSNPSSLAHLSVLGCDNVKMDNIIRNKLGDALRWICLYAPAELLTGTDTAGTNTGVVYEGTVTPTTPITDASAGIVDGAPSSVTQNRFVLPSNFIKLVRVRGASWHRAVSGESVLREDSDEYLQLHDPTNAYATADRPQAAIINKERKELECWPSSTSFEFTCIVSPATVNVSSETASVALPPLAKTSFIYYLAYLLCSAYGDERANRMLEIAKQNLGRTDK